MFKKLFKKDVFEVKQVSNKGEVLWYVTCKTMQEAMKRFIEMDRDSRGLYIVQLIHNDNLVYTTR